MLNREELMRVLLVIERAYGYGFAAAPADATDEERREYQAVTALQHKIGTILQVTVTLKECYR
jgi:hypothetical protein